MGVVDQSIVHNLKEKKTILALVVLLCFVCWVIHQMYPSLASCCCGPPQVLDEYANSISVEDIDVWSILYGPICFIIGFRFLFYIALITKHSGSRK